MTEQKDTKPLKAYERFALASVANQFVKQGQFDLANTALGEIKFGSDMEAFIKNSKYLASQQGIQEASTIFDGEFNNSLLEQKASSMIDFYGKPTNNLANGSQSKINNIYTTLGDKTLGDVMKNYQEASGVLKLSEQYKDKFSEVDVKSAQGTVDKYQMFMGTHGLLMDTKFRTLANGVQDQHTQSLLEQIAEGLPEIKKEEKLKV